MSDKKNKKSQTTSDKESKEELDTMNDNDSDEKQAEEIMTASKKLQEYAADLKKMAKELSKKATELKNLEKMFNKEKKAAEKKAVQKKKTNSKKNGLETPIPLSDVLCQFLNIEKGSRMSRNKAKAGIRAHIRDKKLQNPNNRRELIPDKKLKSILIDYVDGDELTYFTLEKYIKKHFLPLPK